MHSFSLNYLTSWMSTVKTKCQSRSFLTLPVCGTSYIVTCTSHRLKPLFRSSALCRGCLDLRFAVCREMWQTPHKNVEVWWNFGRNTVRATLSVCLESLFSSTTWKRTVRFAGQCCCFCCICSCWCWCCRGRWSWWRCQRWFGEERMVLLAMLPMWIIVTKTWQQECR